MKYKSFAALFNGMPMFLASVGISDDIDDPRNSIYSVEASSQRKVNFIVVHTQD